jgi:uncharacterized protein (DUF927 family)
MNDSFIKAVAAAALASFDAVMARLGLNDGKREGREYLPVNPTRADGKPGSFSINMDTGKWSDFATQDKGGDLVSLAAYVLGCKQGEAARELAAVLGMADAGDADARRAPTPTPPHGGKAATGEQWVSPVPADATPPHRAHMRHGTPSKTYAYRTADGGVSSYVCRFDTADGKEFAPQTLWRNADGAMVWRWKAPPVPRLLYRCDELAKRADAPVMVCEGEKAADAATALFPSFVVTCWPNGANAADKADFSPLAGRDVTLWPDFDAPGRAAMAKVTAILSAQTPPPSALRMVKPEFFGLSAQGDDAADVTGWSAERCADECKRGEWREAVNMTTPTPTAKPKKSTGPRTIGRFRTDKTGVWCDETGRDGETTPKWICAPLDIQGSTRDGDAKNWGLGVSFPDPDGMVHYLVIPKRALLGEGNDALRLLIDEGLRVAAGKPSAARLVEYLATANPSERIRTTTRTGWHGNDEGRVFVLADAAYGASVEPWFLDCDAPTVNPFTIKGSVEDWREHVASLCVGNSRLLFAVSVMFAAPLLAILGYESGGFHFRGNSSTGKTSILRAAASVCGGKAYVEQWRATDNALEAMALQHCDAGLILDELAMLDPKVAGDVAYMLANGGAKARATRTGQARNRATWNLYFLSSGEVSLSQHMAEAGKAARAGQELRVVDIPVDAGAGFGAWEDLHECAHGADFSRRLTEAAAQYHGAVLRAYLERLARTPADEVRRHVRNVQQRFAKAAYLTEAASGQARRVSERFALAAAGGELATLWGLTGWRAGEPGENGTFGDAEQAAGTCFSAWLKARGGEGNQEREAMMRWIIGLLEESGAAFDLWHRLNDDHAPKPPRRLGVARWQFPCGKAIRTAADKGEEFARAEYMTEWFIFREQFRQRAQSKGFDDRAVLRLLAEHGYIAHDAARYERQVRLPGHGQVRVIHVLPSILTYGDATPAAPLSVKTCAECSDTSCPDKLGPVGPVTN